MTDQPAAVERELESHDAFAPRGDNTGYDLETTVFETTVTAEEGEGNRDGEFHITIALPTLSAAAADTGPTVEQVVEDGWFETLERRLEDTFSLAHTSTHEEPVLERDPDEVRVILEYVAWDAAEGVEDAKTLLEYVEGTYAQGIVPGYEYEGEAATLLENAQSQGQQATEGNGNSGGMPM
ncbi:hypothetical protein HALLA_06840 [Halostagnicola larsenii XH-48]|uniref:Uncharacterized protein n=1 Tax=Halostagnicola larsenii XH-48 TaxID=797299 RepID=W0JN65_9EURY|nr:DUF5813 family protein [Halostagnicola larsenii]AHF98609.1 hypothetical protein HALLA_06840 [Halostagnicola larsenii XH-48]